MNKVVKFCAWNERDQKMEYDVHTNFSVKERTSKAVKRGYQWNDFENTGTIYDAPLMQYTGLKDVNGVEIYEGCVLRQYSGDVLFPDVIVVASIHDYNAMNTIASMVTHCDVEVIGNIFENPEWLGDPQ